MEKLRHPCFSPEEEYWLKMDPQTVPASTPLHPDFINNLQRGRYLDVGCGSGRISGQLRDQGHLVVAIDTNQFELSKGISTYPNISFVRTIGEQLPFAENTFDGALLLGVLGGVGVKERQRILGDSVRCVRPSGIVYISEFTRITNPKTLTSDGRSWVNVYTQDQEQTQENGSVIVHNLDGTTRFVAHHFTEKELRGLLLSHSIRPSVCKKMDILSTVSNQTRKSITVWGYKS